MNDGEDKNYAMKIINRNLVMKQSQSTGEVLAEFEILKKLYHPNIIQLIEVIDDPKIDKFFLVMDLMKGGNLEERL
jgi:serine/threonine protein kinase